ncbi:MAG: FecR domain-containing protein [Patescibacteria group bacterium]
MQQRFWLVLGGIVLAAIGAYFSMKSASVPVNDVLSIPWIEITSPGVSLLKEDGVLVSLNTGDDITSRATIISDGSGKASIHLPDGSVIRLDSNSKIILVSALFDPKTETLNVKISLIAGRVWSKVTSLVTPESSWEVKTASAVATVRGTAFSMEYANGKSRVLGSQNVIIVNPVDQKTGETLPGIQSEVKENTAVELSDKDAAVIAERFAENKKAAENLGIVLLLPRKASREALNDPFIKENKSEDKIFDEKTEIIRKEGLSEYEVREIIRTESKEFRDKIIDLKNKEKSDEEIKKEIMKEDAADFRARIKEQAKKIKEERKGVEQDNKTEETKTTDSEKSGDATQVKSPSGASPKADSNSSVTEKVDTTSSRKVARLTIGGFKTTALTEGDKVSLVATVIFNNGEKENVTSAVSWTVTGFVGSVEKGIFTAKIRPEDSEIGEVGGTIQAKIDRGGTVFTSNLIEVIITPSIEETTPLG